MLSSNTRHTASLVSLRHHLVAIVITWLSLRPLSWKRFLVTECSNAQSITPNSSSKQSCIQLTENSVQYQLIVYLSLIIILNKTYRMQFFWWTTSSCIIAMQDTRGQLQDLSKTKPKQPIRSNSTSTTWSIFLPQKLKTSKTMIEKG